MLFIDMRPVVKGLFRTQTTVWLCFMDEVTALWMSHPPERGPDGYMRWVFYLYHLEPSPWRWHLGYTNYKFHSNDAYPHPDTSTKGQRARKMDPKRLDFSTFYWWVNLLIVSVQFTYMPVRVLISPNERFSPFCVDIHDRFGWARLCLDKRSACKDRPICTMSTT